MSWTLVSTTDTGYRKYRDQWGNFRYLDPNGNFTNAQAWAGTHSQGATEIPEYTGDIDFPSAGKSYRIRDDLDSYKEAIDIVYDEPFENDYTPPVGFPFNAYPIEDYPSRKRLDQLIEDIEDNKDEYDCFSVGVKSVIYDEDYTVISSSERHTALHSYEDINLIRIEWANLMEELGMIGSDYGGVAIFESLVKFRSYKEEYQ
jgi:hypothetical protein